MNMVSFKNKLQSSEISVGLNSNKSQNSLDDLFAELFALVNLGDDSSEKLISPEKSEVINHKSIAHNDYSAENQDKETLDLAKSLAEVFYKDLGIVHGQIKQDENSKLHNYAATTHRKTNDHKSLDKIIPLKNLPSENKLLTKIGSEQNKIVNNENPLKSLASKHNLVFNIKKKDIENNNIKKNYKEEILNPKTSNPEHSNKIFNNNTTNLSSSIKNSVKKISIDLKEKKTKKRTQNEVFENKIEDKNLAEKTFKEISPKIVNHLTRNTEKKITETNINLKNTNNGKIKFSEKGLDNKQHFMNEQTLDLLESSWGEKFTKILKNSIDNGIQKIEIFLKPKNLGKINLEVLLKDKQTHININTESQETANILNENLPKINDIVEEKNNKFSLLNDNNGNNHSNHQNQGKKNSIDSSVNKKKKINEVKVVRENNRNIDVNA